ncbi:MAG: DnaJ C-terminal domain-containing protein, partial [Planctomycetia bacterium]|nr:DnaJ C-terminal domain-containing protein [Planctomycetia bacterium]
MTLLEAARGVTKTVHFQRHERCVECEGSGAKKGTKPESCKYCGGHGQVVQSSGIFRVQTTCPACQGQGSVVKEHCSACKGRGHIPKRVQRDVEIPAGVDGQTKLRLSGEGEPSPNGGPSGDVYCFIHVEEHELFVRDGQNLICQVPISYTQAALGAKIDVPTLDGRETLDIPPGTQPGDVFTMRNRGMPDPRRRGLGDLLVQVHLEVPKRLDAREEQLLRELA